MNFTHFEVFADQRNELNQIMTLDQDLMPFSWSKSSWESLNFNAHKLFALKDNEDLFGFILFGQTKLDDTSHLLKIAIKPRYRGLGLAAHLFNCSLKALGFHIKSIYLEVSLTNKEAIGLYQGLGFQKLRIAKKFYSNGEDALIMSKSL
jgi:ribosomal-protein-alanine N-acetyltransferase